MLKFNLKYIRQFRNCVNLLNQSTLAKSIKLDDQQNNEFNNSNLSKTQFTNKQNNVNLSNSNQLNNQFNHVEKLNLVNFNKSDKLLKKSSPEEQDSNKPSREQMEEFHLYLEDNFPKFFTERINLAYFDEFITIEDNQSGITKKEFGFSNLVKKISFIRIYYSSMYSFNTMKVLSIAKIPEEGLVKLRWRISSRGRLLSFLQIWKVQQFKKNEFWTDGIVYFYLNKNGKVKRLVIEKVEKDKDENLAKIPLGKIAKV